MVPGATTGEIHFQARGMAESLRLDDKEISVYTTVKDKLDSHSIARRNVIFQRAKCNMRQQEAGETVDSFITALH